MSSMFTPFFAASSVTSFQMFLSVRFETEPPSPHMSCPSCIISPHEIPSDAPAANAAAREANITIFFIMRLSLFRLEQKLAHALHLLFREAEGDEIPLELFRESVAWQLARGLCQAALPAAVPGIRSLSAHE